jgi:ABC-2 type transport system ATP-binding protein
MAIIEVDSLSKHFKILNRHEGLTGALRDLFSNDYRTVKAVDGISFAIEPGEIVGYIGPNGAGKSTTIKMMTGILKPTSGTVCVNGKDPFTNRQKNAQNIGVIFGQRTQLWWDLPVVESFKLLKEMYRVDHRTYEHQLGMFSELADIKAFFHQTVRSLSLGQRMLCDIAASFLHNPAIVFLDEPTIGLDISIKARIRGLIKELNQTNTTTIILTTHDIGDVEALCKRIIIIDQGHIIYDGDIKRVNRLFGAFRTLRAEVRPFEGEQTIVKVRQALVERYGENRDVSVRSREDGWIDITFRQDEQPLIEVLNFIMASFTVRDVQIVELALEGVIRQIYEGALK